MSQTTIERQQRRGQTLRTLFLDHPQEAGETYFQHMRTSAAFGFRLLKLALTAFAHAVVPGVHKTTVSTAIKSMAGDMGGRAEEARQERMRHAGVWDVGL